MDKQKGFSLMEVLVSLLLVTMTALILLEQQWQNLQWLRQIQLRNGALFELDNATEYCLSQCQSSAVKSSRYELKQSHTQGTLTLQILWQNPNEVINTQLIRVLGT